MVSLEQIREELKDVRYYYQRKEVFDRNAKTVGASFIKRKADKYNALVVDAPPKLYDVYIGLYVQGSTQEGYAVEVGYSPKYIQKLHSELIKFFQNKLKEV